MNDNKQKILSSALRLFNEKGTSEVSTNHICDYISISPGNLYYHFRSKEEIIISLFQQMIQKWDSKPVLGNPSLDILFSMYEKVFQFLWDYRFIHREISALYHRIEQFRTIFDKVQQRRIKEIQKFISEYSKTGVFRSMNKKEIKALSRTIWFFSLYWITYLETEGKKITRNSLKESIDILKGIVQPYIKT